MSLCAFLALMALDEGKEGLAFFLIGPAGWAWVIIGRSVAALYKRIRLRHFRNHYSALLFMCKGQSWTTYYVRNELIDAFYTEKDNHPAYYVKEIRSCKSAKSVPFKQNMINKNGFLTTNGNSQFICNFIRPYWDLYNKFQKTS